MAEPRIENLIGGNIGPMRPSYTEATEEYKEDVGGRYSPALLAHLTPKEIEGVLAQGNVTLEQLEEHYESKPPPEITGGDLGLDVPPGRDAGQYMEHHKYDPRVLGGAAPGDGGGRTFTVNTMPQGGVPTYDLGAPMESRGLPPGSLDPQLATGGFDGIDGLGGLGGDYKKTTTVRNYESPELTKEAAIRQQAGQQKLIQYLQDRRNDKREAYTKMQEFYKNQDSKHKKHQKDLLMEKEYMLDKIEMLESTVLKGVEDPFKRLPVASKVASMISIGLGSVSRSFGGNSTNVALNMFNKALDKDMQQQKLQLGRVFEMLKLNVGQKNNLVKQLEKSQEQQRSDALQVFNLEVIKNNVDKTDVTAWQNAIDLSVKIDKMATPKTKTTTTTVKEEGMKAGDAMEYKFKMLKALGKKPLGPVVGRRITEGMTAIDNLKLLYREIKAYKGADTGNDYWAWVLEKTPGVKDFTDAGSIGAFAGQLSLQLASTANQGRPSTPDQVIMKPMVAGTFNNMEQVKSKLERLRRQAIHVLKRNIDLGESDNFNVEAAKIMLAELQRLRFN